MDVCKSPHYRFQERRTDEKGLSDFVIVFSQQLRRITPSVDEMTLYFHKALRIWWSCNLWSTCIGLPGWVQHASVLIQSDELVGCRDGVQVGLFAVVEVRVRLPDALQHRNAEGQGLFVTLEGKPTIYPRLPEVAVHRVSLETWRVILTGAGCYSVSNLLTCFNAVHGDVYCDSSNTVFWFTFRCS